LCSRIDEGKSNSTKTRDKTYEIDLNSKPRRAQGGLSLLSHTISVQKPQESIPLILILERRKREEERGAWEVAAVCVSKRREKKRNGGGI
jgi:hypothetical protein